MAEPSSYRPAPGEIPTDPGVYRFRDADGRVIYVGKAKNLRNRLNSYFASPQTPVSYTHLDVYKRQREYASDRSRSSRGNA